mmetsp:Transcript_20696/g.55374  ORF Transcript_20696/g.55374 Transcript_20696/m.55374 type:complete len:264 (+) Transcript_20696:240-1031(+)
MSSGGATGRRGKARRPANNGRPRPSPLGGSASTSATPRCPPAGARLLGSHCPRAGSGHRRGSAAFPHQRRWCYHPCHWPNDGSPGSSGRRCHRRLLHPTDLVPPRPNDNPPPGPHSAGAAAREVLSPLLPPPWWRCLQRPRRRPRLVPQPRPHRPLPSPRHRRQPRQRVLPKAPTRWWRVACCCRTRPSRGASGAKTSRGTPTPTSHFWLHRSRSTCGRRCNCTPRRECTCCPGRAPRKTSRSPGRGRSDRPVGRCPHHCSRC